MAYSRHCFHKFKSEKINLIILDSSGIDNLEKESTYYGSTGDLRQGLGVDMKMYDYMKRYMEINYSLLKQGEFVD